LTFYRTEYDRESLPRYALSGALLLPYLGRWVADRLGLGAPLEIMDPFRVIEMKAPQTKAEAVSSGPQFLQAFGLALRGLCELDCGSISGVRGPGSGRGGRSLGPASNGSSAPTGPSASRCSRSPVSPSSP